MTASHSVAAAAAAQNGWYSDWSERRYSSGYSVIIAPAKPRGWRAGIGAMMPFLMVDI